MDRHVRSSTWSAASIHQHPAEMFMGYGARPLHFGHEDDGGDGKTQTTPRSYCKGINKIPEVVSSVIEIGGKQISDLVANVDVEPLPRAMVEGVACFCDCNQSRELL
ncbi:unnamed protein product [Sphagnum jensenii]|uniref:Uncharacterized protein n=1 Tax=Sphagnum jensenii TaxID=128206 RepID=A0ABP1BW16_9BRYO